MKITSSGLLALASLLPLALAQSPVFVVLFRSSLLLTSETFVGMGPMWWYASSIIFHRLNELIVTWQGIGWGTSAELALH